DDGNGSGQLLRRSDGSIAVGQHHIRRLFSPDRPAQFLELAPKYFGPTLSLRIVLGIQHEYADAASPLRQFRAGAERPRDGRAAEESNEFAPSHCLPKGSQDIQVSPFYKR